MDNLKNLECVLPKTKTVLLKLVESCEFLENYVLVGGSALTMHLCHRRSEDLVFFTYGDSFSKKAIFDVMQYFQQKELLNQSDEQIDVLLDEVKVTFFNARWSFLKPQQPSRFNLATLEQLSAMKVNVLFLRAKYRDYYDLYFLSKEVHSLQQIFELSKNIVEGVTYKLFVVGEKSLGVRGLPFTKTAIRGGLFTRPLSRKWPSPFRS